MLLSVDDAVSPGEEGVDSSVGVATTTVRLVSVDILPSGPVTVLVILEVDEVVPLLAVTEGAAVVDPLSEVVCRVDCVDCVD